MRDSELFLDVGELAFGGFLLLVIAGPTFLLISAAITTALIGALVVG